MENCSVLLAILLCGFIASSTAAHSDKAFRVGRNQISYYAEELSEERFLEFSRLSNTTHLRETLRHILVPRIVGTELHRQVRDYIVNSLKASEWSVELHKFHDTVPIFDKLHFHNIIAKLNPNAERYLVMACHYDSKYMPDFEFIGATDSAVPCAMLLNMAHLMQAQLQPFRDSSLSLMFIFFDGEEAFKEWGPQDSIYGARRLAQKWDGDGFIDRIDLLMLLDLIGAPDPKFYSFFKNTESWYSRLIEIEDRLSGAGLLERYISSGIAQQHPNRYFQPKSLRSSQVEDDHIPFLRRDVPVLHLIPLPFPTVWHTKDDNEAAIDYATTENIGRIVRLFAMEYLYSGIDKNWNLENLHGSL